MGIHRWRQARQSRRERGRVLRELPACGSCGHGWDEHDGAWGEPDGEPCGECSYESDHGERARRDECRAACPLLTPRQVGAFQRLSGEVPGDPTQVPTDELDADHRHIDSWLAGVISSHRASSSQVRDLRGEMETAAGRAFADRLAVVLENSDADADGSP